MLGRACGSLFGRSLYFFKGLPIYKGRKCPCVLLGIVLRFLLQRGEECLLQFLESGRGNDTSFGSKRGAAALQHSGSVLIDVLRCNSGKKSCHDQR